MSKIDRIEEMEKQLSALKAEIEEKPGRVRVYIKEWKNGSRPFDWNPGGEMDYLPGTVQEVAMKAGDGDIRIKTDSPIPKCGGWRISDYEYIVVEGSLEDLK